MIELPIQDKLFSHAFSSSDWYKPTYFKWTFNQVTDKDYTFLTDWHIIERNYPPKKLWAWLVESPGIMANAYQFVRENTHLFDKIFTHNRNIIETNPDKAYLLPIGGCHLSDDQIGLQHTKTKLISMMFSGQRWLPGHQLRHEIYRRYSDKIHCMGSGITGVKLHKFEACRDHKFQVTIENVQEDYYFTEKLIDVLLTGGIPIYWGCPSIGKFFNTKGFLIFNNLEELETILNSDLEEFYSSHQEEIKENYTKALKFKIAEDYLWENYKELL